MRSGSPAHDGRGWSPAQPEFRQAEFDSGEYRLLVESSNASYGRDPGYGHVDPRGTGGSVPGYQQPGTGYQPAQPSAAARRPAEDYDYGYGDPGYADPSYDGYQGYPSAPAAPVVPAAPVAPAYQPPAPPAPSGYQQPRPGAATNADQIYPVTGAQEVYREAPQSHPHPPQEEPRRHDEPRYDGRPADPRLAGLRYDELRYDDGGHGYAGSRHDEPLDDDAWYEELRRGGPAFEPRRPGPDPSGRPGPEGPAASGGHQQASGYDRPSGNPSPAPGNGGNGYGGYGPRMSAVPAVPVPGIGSGPLVGLSRGVPGTPGAQASPMAQQQAAGFQAAPTFTPSPSASVGVLTPPAGNRHQTRVESPQAFGQQAPRLGAAAIAPPANAPVRPAGPPATAGPQATAAMPAMTGPDTAVWDIETEDDELEVLEQYWQEEDDDGGYPALTDDFGEDDVRRDKDSKPARATRVKRVGRRRGGSNDHKLLLGLVGIVVVAGGAIFGITKFAFPHASGPAHELVTPATIGSYQWAPKAIPPAKMGPLIHQFQSGLGSQATNVVDRVYESGSATSGGGAQIVMFMGGRLPNLSPASSVANFLQEFKGAQVVSAGPMGGEAACTEGSIGTPDQAALCVWFDNDSVGVVTSATMSAAKLDQVMLQFRPQLELMTK